MKTTPLPPRFRLRQFVAAAGLAFAVAWQGHAAQPADGKLVMNMRDADIRTMIQWVADVTGKNIVVHKDVQGTVTVLSAEPVTPQQAYEVFLATLDVHGFAAIDDGSSIKIVPASMANSSNPPIGRGSASGETIISVIKANNVPAEKLASNLRPLVPQSAMLTAYPETNSLIVASSANNVQRINELVRLLDQGGNLQFESIRLQHANAQDVEKNLGQLVPGLAGAEGYKFVTLAVDTRTNTILLGGDPANRKQVRAIIASLDQEVAGGNTDVIYLQYVQAEEMLAILKGVAESLQDGGGGGGGQGGGGGGGGGSTGTKVSIEASKSTNALIINAPPAIVAKMRSIVEQVDVRRPQVMVEALVVEVTDDGANDLGVSWVATEGKHFPSEGGNAAVNGLGDLASGILTDDDGNPIISNGKPVIRPQEGLTLGYLDNGDVKALLRALNKTTKTNILSTPTIVALDNEEAELLVGQSVPFKTGEALTEGTTATNPFTTIEREDIGLNLVIKPQINQGDSITLELMQKTESISPSTQASDIITNKRLIKTKALIRDDQTLVIGGLLRDSETESRSNVPILGSIPLIGNLFGSRSKNREKVNLMVFIHPTILKTEEQMTSLTRERYDYMRGKQALSMKTANPFEKEPPPEMPEFETFSPK